MKQFEINKGIGRSVEFKGLKAQYLFIFAGGLLAKYIPQKYLLFSSAVLFIVLGVVMLATLFWKSGHTPA